MTQPFRCLVRLAGWRHRGAQSTHHATHENQSARPSNFLLISSQRNLRAAHNLAVLAGLLRHKAQSNASLQAQGRAALLPLQKKQKKKKKKKTQTTKQKQRKTTTKQLRYF